MSCWSKFSDISFSWFIRISPLRSVANRGKAKPNHYAMPKSAAPESASGQEPLNPIEGLPQPPISKFNIPYAFSPLRNLSVDCCSCSRSVGRVAEASPKCNMIPSPSSQSSVETLSLTTHHILSWQDLVDFFRLVRFASNCQGYFTTERAVVLMIWSDLEFTNDSCDGRWKYTRLRKLA